MKRTRTDELLQQMADAPVEVEDPKVAAARRERVVGRLNALHDELLAQGDARRRWRRGAWMVAAAAAAVLMVGGGVYAVSSESRDVAQASAASQARLEAANGSVRVERAGQSLAARAAQVLKNEDKLVTGKHGSATVRLASGADVAIGPNARFALRAGAQAAERAERVDLGLGEVRVHVPKLPAGGSFGVKTPDTLVQVHGTRFAVLVVKDQRGVATRVSVSEGRVSVDSSGKRTFLDPGAVWWSRHLTTAERKPAPVREPESQPDEPKPKPQASQKTAQNPPAKTSSLAAQNRIFQAAMDARRRGDDQRAVALIDSLLAKYPDSPLEQEARVERFRALERMGQHAEAARAARRYLAEHPEGFAGDEARDVVLKPDSKP